MTGATPETAPERGRRWPSLSLRASMLLVLLLGLPMGWKARRASIQRRAVAGVERLHGTVEYDWQYSRDPMFLSPPGPSAPAWLRRAIGDEYFQEVAAVTIPDQIPGLAGPGESFEDSPFERFQREFAADQLACLDGLDHLESLRIEFGELGPAGLARIGRMTRLKELTILGGDLGAAGPAEIARLAQLEALTIPVPPGPGSDLAFLDRLPNLRSIQLLRTEVDDRGMARIGRLSRLRSIWLVAPGITDAGLAHLEGLGSLEMLVIQGGRGITDAGLAHLEALPELSLVDLPQTPATEAGLARFRRMPKLGSLSIGRGRLDDAAITAFKAAEPNLRSAFRP